MRNIKLFGLSAAILAGVCFFGAHAMSQDKAGGAYDKPKDKPASTDKPVGDKPATDKPTGDKPAGGMDEAAMKVWAESMAPGPHHKALEAMAGKFTYVNKFRMDPSQDWQTAEGEYDGEMIMGGRYLATNNKGPFMGGEFHGMGVMGYDNVAKKHVSGWIDNMGTGLMRSEGTCDAGCKTITYEGEMLDPMAKQMTKYRYGFEIKSNDEFVMHWWSPNPADGKMAEVMTISYTRVK